MTSIAMEEYELMKDSKYRMYVAAVDKALKNFEYTSEWADLIAALGKLNKVLTSYTKFPVIPRRIKISKRLAQCMHPALPSGVHLKALETYDIIFRCMGTTRLSHELFIYSAGLFPLLGHAAMNIRPALLTIYETHFVPLRERLRPALSGFLTGVLPGLETGSDHFDRTNTLLENVCDGVGPAWFYTCIWQCVRSNSPIRLPAISYVLAHYSKKMSMEDQLYLMGNDIDVMISGLCAAVQDSSVLVQRSALDLLMVCFPMTNTQLLYADMVRLVTAALTTILRRDMSLNRRLYSWLLNSDSNTPPAMHAEKIHQEVADLTESHTIAYDLLNEAIRVILKHSTTEVPLDIKPYRLLTSLFDKPQIGPVILDSILYDVFRALYLACLHQQRQKNNSVRCVSFNGDLTSLKLDVEVVVLSKEYLARSCQELIKNANLLFNTLQSYYIWSYIEKLYREAAGNVQNSRKSLRDRAQVHEIGAGAPGVLEICVLTDFLLDIIPVESYADSTSEILPNLFNKIVATLKQHIDVLNKCEIEQSLRLASKILSKIQPISLVPVPKQEIAATTATTNNADLEESSENENVASKSLETPQIEVSDVVKETKGLEKSKSDSKINENLNKNELTIDDSSRERSFSNQMLKKKEKTSPKIDKKSKNKKSKSSSKLYDLKTEESEGLVCESVEVAVQQQQNKEPVKLAGNTMKVENKSFIKCLEEYKAFYVSFLRAKIITDVDVEGYFRGFVIDKEEGIRRLEQLLGSCIKNTPPPPEEARKPRNQTDYVGSEEESEFDSAMAVASDVLLEFTTFPNLLSGGEVKSGEQLLPFWLETLVVCACSQQSSCNVQIIAMNTLLEVFSLAKSEKLERDAAAGEGAKVVQMGILEREYVVYVEDSTRVIEVMCRILWEFLGRLSNQKQVITCVNLLYHVHNVFDTKLFVEDVIGEYLVGDNLNVEFFKRFSLLWHLGRDLNIKLPSHHNHNRNLDRTLLKVLDNLQNTEKAELKFLAETFLTHSLLRNDIPRIINPLLTKLLAPRTARISIRHVNIHDSDSQSEQNVQEHQNSDEKAAKKVFAVSNENGNIMYHITDEPSPKPPKKKWYLFSKAGKKYTQVVNMTASLTENLNIVTKKNKDFKNQEASPNFSRNSKNNVKLFINPLSAKEIYPDGLDGSYTKLDPNESQRSSSDSLSSDSTQCDSPETPFPSYEAPPSIQSRTTDRDSGFESLVRQKSQTESMGSGKNSETTKRNLLEHLEPISDGIKTVVENGGVKLPKSQSFDEKSNCEKIADLQNGALVHSWSYCISDSDNLNAELEISTSAEDFFKGGDHAIVAEVLNEIVCRVCGDDERNTDSPSKLTRPVDLDLKPKIVDHSTKNFNIYPMHYHLCLYYEVFDSNQILYAFETLKNSILANPQLFIRCLATSGLKDLRNNDILHLLARHRKSILGCMFSGELQQEHINFYRGYTFLDVLMSVCLNFARSFYPSLDDPNLTADEMRNNLKIQLASLEILDIIIRNLLTLVKENSKGFSSYIADMLVKCKLQKVLLHCLLTSVRNFDEDLSFAEEILLFNNFQLFDANNKVGEHVEAFQTQMLRLIHSLIILEYHVFPTNQETNATTVQSPAPSVNGEHISYTPTVLIPQQQIFLSAIMSALRHQNMKNLHEKWCNMVTSCLPYFGENLKQISLSVVHQICNNIEEIAANYRDCQVDGELCSDYAVTQLESLTIFCHYCLLDSSQNNPANASTPLTNPSEILNNLVNAFFSPMANDLNTSNKQNSDHYQSARKTVLSHMPRIISSVAKLWQTVISLENDYSGIYGNIKVVKQQLLEFLSPISVHHSASFLAAVAVTWFERRNIFSNVKTVLPEPNASQSNLVYLISAIRVIPLDNLVQTVTAVIKNPPPTEGLSNDICLDVCVLELFYCYMRNASATQLSEAWSSLLTLIREGCSLSPPAQFLLAALLHELMIKCCPLEERKDQKDLQDVTAKLIECVSQVCGSCLEQTTWLRRNLAVKEQDEDASPTVSVISGANSDVLVGNSHSVQAQLVLSEILAPILDICFGSSEKDKVNTILTSLMYNIVPYLKTHTLKNMPSFQACSKLLASLSSYQYTRKAWKKDVFDLLLDSAFFQMDYSCLKYWKVIVDNLMTHDNTTFRDLMSRVSMTQSGSLSLFSSREQEYEQKALLLKRLAFVIFCSEMDQYAKYMPDIQEQLTSSLRLNNPGVQAQVFLCFRVILLRMTPLHVTSLWPIIISEMLQVFLQIEQELSTDTEEFRTNSSSHIKLLSTLDASWATNSSNGLHALGHPNWLKLQFATAKLLDLALLLPATSLPQFQMYRWAFVGDDLAHVSTNYHEQSCFIPHVTRIAGLMDQKFTDTQIETLPTKQNELLLTINTINQLKDLHGFFKTLSLCSNRHRTECSGSVQSDHLLQDRQVDKKMSAILEKVDKIVDMDFLEKIIR